MGERMFWIDENEEGSDEFESSRGSDEDPNYSKRLRLSPDHLVLHPQEGNADTGTSAQPSSPLGLTLTKTPSFLSLLQHRLSKGKQPHAPQPGSNSKHASRSAQSASEKLKASNFPATFIQIGSWRRISRHEGELVAKLYYAKRKLVWELLDGALKSKIEMQWSDIAAIRAITPDDEPGTLEIELNRPPLFYRESSPQPRKHTLWHQTGDFTGGQAPVWRRHYVRFPPGILDRHYNKLLQCDERLFALSQKPFPSCESPYFNWNVCRIIPNAHSYPYGTYPTATLELAPNSIISGMDLTLGSDLTDWGNPSQRLSQMPGSSQVLHYQNTQPNVGFLNNSTEGTVYTLPEPAPAYPNYCAYGYSMTDQARSGANPSDGLYSEGTNWFGHQEAAAGINMDQNVHSSSVLPYYPDILHDLGYFNP